MAAAGPLFDPPRELVPVGMIDPDARPRFMFDGELLDDYLIAVWGRLGSQRAACRRLSRNSIWQKMFIIREWRRLGGSSEKVAYAMQRRGWVGMTAVKVNLLIRLLKAKGTIPKPVRPGPVMTLS